MRLAARVVICGTLAACSGLMLAMQSGGAAATAPVGTQSSISFQFERPGMPVPHFILQVREDGTGSYQADVTPGVASDSSMPVGAPQHVNRAITLTHATVAKMFKTAHELNRFNIECDSKAKNIANTGIKTLTYAGADGRGSCVYNYSENKDVAALTDTFMGIAFTLDEARRLDFLHRFDRLGLDAEMNSLTDEAKAGRALELGTITPTLNSIAGDMAVIQRVRLQAAKLLEQAKDK